MAEPRYLVWVRAICVHLGPSVVAQGFGTSSGANCTRMRGSISGGPTPTLTKNIRPFLISTLTLISSATMVVAATAPADSTAKEKSTAADRGQAQPGKADKSANPADKDPNSYANRE